MIDLVFQNSTSDKRYTSKFFEKILLAGIKELKLSKALMGVSVNLVGEGRIKELNCKYRHKNKVTDVLSFPMANNLKSLQALDLGDLFICLPFAKKEVKRENTSIERKLAQLTVHGFLHLLGYEHENSVAGAKEMEQSERLILNRLDF